MNRNFKLLLFFLSVFYVQADVFAQASQVKLARNSMAKLNDAISEKADIKKQLNIIGEGIKALDLAEKDKRTKKWAETWAIKAYLSSYIALIDDNENNAAKYFDLATLAKEQANSLDKFQTNTELINAADYNIHAKIQRNGQKAFKLGEYESAFEQLKKVSNYLPTDTLLAMNAAISALNQKLYDDALIYFKRAIENGIANPIVYQQTANLYSSKFDYDSAIKIFENGLKLNPQNLLLTNDYINVLLDSEQFEKANKAIEQLIKIDNQNRLLYYLQAYLEQNNLHNHSQAELVYKKAINLDHNYFEALYQLALIYIQNANSAIRENNLKTYNSNINRAEFSLLRALEINPHHQKTTQLLIEIYTRKNRLDKVQELKRLLNEF